jgi:polyisoprenoid-binding protein YceI
MSVSTNQTTQRWIVDPARSTVEFQVKSFWGLTRVVGRFARFDGVYTLGPNGRAVELIISADSVDTGNRRRDEHLRSNAFFAAEAHPVIRFAADDVTDAGALRVRGVLEVAGGKLPLSLEAAIRELDGELEIEASALVDQRDFGMTFSPLGSVRAPALLRVTARLTEENR